MNRRDIVVCLLSSAVPLGRVHAQQTGKVYYIAFIVPVPVIRFLVVRRFGAVIGGVDAEGRRSSVEGQRGASRRGGERYIAAWRFYRQAMAAAGIYAGGNALQVPETGTSPWLR